MNDSIFYINHSDSDDSDEGLKEALARREMVVYPDKQILVTAVATRMLLKISDLLTRQERVDVALTGGTTGIDVLKAASVSTAQGIIEFPRVHFWFGDERFVQQDSDDRNAKQAREAWLDSLVRNGLLPEENIHEMPADTRSRHDADIAPARTNDEILDAAAERYNDELSVALGSKERKTLDIALFGVGPDGHFASLFPHHHAMQVHEADQRVTGVSHSPKMPPLRLSLTLPFIQQTNYVWMVASGLSKADAVHSAIEHPGDPDIPSSFAAGHRQTLWMVDRDAFSAQQHILS